MNEPRVFFKNGKPFDDTAAMRQEAAVRASKGETTTSGTRRRHQCQVCVHPERHRIEALKVGGVGLDKLAAQFDIHRDAIWRHMQHHVGDATKANYLIGAAKVEELVGKVAEEQASLLDYYCIVRSTLFGQLDIAATQGKPYTIEKLSHAIVNVLREIGHLTGEATRLASITNISVTNNTQILNSQPFTELQNGLIAVCQKHPEARQDILALFRDLDAKHSGRPMIEAKTVPDA
jgi:hypothetical protein